MTQRADIMPQWADITPEGGYVCQKMADLYRSYTHTGGMYLEKNTVYNNK